MNSIIVIAGIVIMLAMGVPVFLEMLRKHPKGLVILFFAEMWERFSFFGMRTLLIFYLTQHFLFDDGRAAAQYGSFATLVYMLPLIGGVVADRILGARKAVAFGALLLVLGHSAMAIEGAPARQFLLHDGARYEIAVEGRASAQRTALVIDGERYALSARAGGGLAVEAPPAGAPSVFEPGAYALETEPGQSLFEHILYLALALIAMGVGFLKGNISTLVHDLYPEGDPRREGGFLLYYFGINLGGFWAAILCGYFGQTYGWSWGFGLAGLGMAAGYIVFVLGRPLLTGKGEPPAPERLTAPAFGPINREWLTYLATILGVVVVYALMQSNVIVGWLLALSSAAVLIYIGWVMATQHTKVERERLGLALLLVAGAVVFWTLFMQAGTSLNLFAERNTDLLIFHSPIAFSAFGCEIFLGTPDMLAAAAPHANRLWIDTTLTSAQMQSFNGAFILLSAPGFAALLTFLAKRNLEPGPMVKFGLGLIQVGAGFLVIVWAQGWADASYRLPLIVLTLTYLLHSTGELFVSPVGLSQVTRLSPAALVSTMMAVWLLSTSAAQYLSAQIAALARTETVAGQALDARAALQSSLGVFETIGWIGVGAGVLFLLLHPLVKNWAHDEIRPAH